MINPPLEFNELPVVVFCIIYTLISTTVTIRIFQRRPTVEIHLVFPSVYPVDLVFRRRLVEFCHVQAARDFDRNGNTSLPRVTDYDKFLQSINNADEQPTNPVYSYYIGHFGQGSARTWSYFLFHRQLTGQAVRGGLYKKMPITSRKSKTKATYQSFCYMCFYMHSQNA